MKLLTLLGTKAPCPKCSGQGKLTVRNFVDGGHVLVSRKCFYCRGKGNLGRH